MSENDQQRTEKIDTSSEIHPDKTSLVIAPGIVIKGDIVSEIEDADARLLILGRVEGNIFTKGVVQVGKGGVIEAGSIITADTLIVSGNVLGANVTVNAQILVIQSTGRVQVGNVRVPPGGLELQRGASLDARMTMSEEPANQTVYPLDTATNDSHGFNAVTDSQTAVGQSAGFGMGYMNTGTGQ